MLFGCARHSTAVCRLHTRAQTTQQLDTAQSSRETESNIAHMIEYFGWTVSQHDQSMGLQSVVIVRANVKPAHSGRAFPKTLGRRSLSNSSTTDFTALHHTPDAHNKTANIHNPLLASFAPNDTGLTATRLYPRPQSIALSC